MLEIIAQSVEDAKCIEASGADRIELVSAISVGGLTPSYGMVEQVIKSVSIPVNVMIRPHGYHFNYKEDDLMVMKRDIEIISSLGANGLVLGVLKDKMIHKEALEMLISSYDQITFHRAIDETDVINSYKSLIENNSITQILTSGGPGKAMDNLEVLDVLYQLSSRKLLLGSGITLNNLSSLVERYPKANFHVGSDARVNQTFSNRIDEKHIKLIVEALKTR